MTLGRNRHSLPERYGIVGIEAHKKLESGEYFTRIKDGVLECFNIANSSSSMGAPFFRHALRGGLVACAERKIEWLHKSEHITININGSDDLDVASWRDTIQRNTEWFIEDLYATRGDGGVDARGVKRRTCACLAHRDLVTVVSYPTSGRLADRMRRDYAITAHSNCKHVVRAFDFLEDAHTIYIVYQPVGCTLRDAHHEGNRDLAIAQRVAAQVLHGLAHLHAMQIAHCDITAQSARYPISGPGDNVLLTDLYYAHNTACTPWVQTFDLDTEHWDISCVKRVSAEKFDVAAVAWLVIELLTSVARCPPLGSVSASHLDTILTNTASVSAVHFLASILCVDECLRPTAQQALKNPWLASMNLKKRYADS